MQENPSEYGRLPTDNHEEILRDIIEDSELGRYSSHEKPKAVIIAGQPGAGKSKLVGDVVHEMRNDCLVIDTDELRAYHPQYEQFIRSNPKTAAEKVHHDASMWTKELRSEAMGKNINLVIDGTLGNPRNARALVDELATKGYEVEIKALAVRKEESMQGIHLRYEKGVQHLRDTGRTDASLRWVDKEVHDKAYHNMPESVGFIEKEKLADRVEVYGRKNEEVVLLYRKDLKNENVAGISAKEVIEAERQRPMTKDERAIFEEKWRDVRDMRLERSADAAEMKEVDRMMKLNGVDATKDRGVELDLSKSR
ncbi:MAG: zeta toxin family protein [Synergistaceae bacterium]|jgi:predicted ABC-type ATPase|nr:zeta toxin family protein [Synergistaceae bacterium]